MRRILVALAVGALVAVASPATLQPAPPPAPAGDAHQHALYRAYVSTVGVDGARLVAATTGLQACRHGRRDCLDRVGRAQQQVATFQSDLAATPAPACLGTADDLLHEGLALQDRGFDLTGQAVAAGDRPRLSRGLLLVAAGGWREGQAAIAARQESC